ncbi:MAG: ABC transporter substrate-binding protein, partial [Anaerolineales bacterium]
MIQKRLLTVLSLIIILVMALSACGPSAPPGQVPPRQAGKGGYLDEIDVQKVDKNSAIAQIQAGTINLFSFNMASTDFPAIKQSGLSYTSSYGGNYSIMLNPAKFKDTTVLNPFSDKKIREAMNWLIDRNYVNQEIYAGGSLAKFFPITTQLVDYTGIVDVARALESKYAFNLDTAKKVISAEMTTLGATAGADGKWQFNGKPVSLAFLIRSDGDGTRKPMGDYVAGQLEKVGFTVDRQYKKSSEASPIWIGSDPVDGKWNMYTAGWINPGLTRDEKASFQQMYLPSSQQGMSVFLANTSVDPAFQKAGDDLANGNFTTTAQRHDLMVKALTLSMQDSLQVWVIEQKSYSPYQSNLNITYDLGSGIEAAPMYPYNLRFTDKEGGQIKIGTNDLFTDPWNSIGGDNYIWDTAIMHMTTQGSDVAASGGIMGDPYTGLAWPQRIATAEVTAQTGLPVSKTLDWVTLKTADKIDVPADALVDWDAKAQKFITASTKFPNGTTAKIKSVVTYPSDLFDTVKWHDGSSLSVADFIMPTILLFDRGSKDSPIYDEAAVPYLDTVKSYFKGFRITSTNPLTIESYSDLYYSDAELDVSSGWPTSPLGLSGENSWDVLAISNMAEAAGQLAYSSDKADAKKIEWMSWIGGPSLDILAKHLDEAIAAGTIPYAPTLGQYITADQAKARYNNLKAWYGVHKHFYIGTGPYYIDQVFLTGKTVTLKNNGWFTDASDRWAKFASPKLASVQLDGPAQVKIGDTATFKVSVTYKGSPYLSADVKQVKYLLYDATGAVLATGEATAGTGDGNYQVVLGPDVTSKLVAGSYKIEVAVVPIPVAIPAFT